MTAVVLTCPGACDIDMARRGGDEAGGGGVGGGGRGSDVAQWL